MIAKDGGQSATSIRQDSTMLNTLYVQLLHYSNSHLGWQSNGPKPEPEWAEANHCTQLRTVQATYHLVYVFCISLLLLNKRAGIAMS